MPMSSYVRTEITIVGANLINWLLHGVLTVQLYLYYLAFPNDRTRTKISVYTVYILETIQAIGLGATLLSVIVGGSCDPGVNARYILSSHQLTSDEYNWSQSLLIDVFGGVVPVITQCIYAHRIRIITQGKAIPCIIIVLATLELLAAILATTITAEVSSIIVGVFWTMLNVANDLIIAFVMVQRLSKEKPLTDYTRSKVIRLVRLIIATGSLTVAANILVLVSLFIDTYIISEPHSQRFGGWPVASTSLGIFIPKIYANSMLVMLNNRMTVRNSRDVTSLSMISINALSTLVIADHQIQFSGSPTSRDEVFFPTSSARSPI